jgi:hypothetical protein
MQVWQYNQPRGCLFCHQESTVMCFSLKWEHRPSVPIKVQYTILVQLVCMHTTTQYSIMYQTVYTSILRLVFQSCAYEKLMRWCMMLHL